MSVYCAANTLSFRTYTKKLKTTKDIENITKEPTENLRKFLNLGKSDILRSSINLPMYL